MYYIEELVLVELSYPNTEIHEKDGNNNVYRISAFQRAS
jgi:hypothetical protein